MIRPHLDVTPLQTDHRFRGIGAYVRGLLDGFRMIGRDVATWGFDVPFDGTCRPQVAVPRNGDDYRSAIVEMTVRGGRAVPDQALPHCTSEITAGTMMRRPYIATVYDLVPLHFPHHYRGGFKRRAWYRLYLRHLKEAALLIAISEATRQDVVERLNRAEDEIVVTPLGIPPLPAPRTPRAVTKYVFVAGTSEPHKNMRFAIDVLGSLPPHLRETPVHVSGSDDGPAWVELTRHAANAGVYLHHLGHVDRRTLSDEYSGAAAVLFPSLWEGFGFPALEAASVGGHVLVSDRGALRELEPVAKVLPLELASWREAVASALEGDSPPTATPTALARYSWEGCATATWRAYEEVSACA